MDRKKIFYILGLVLLAALYIGAGKTGLLFAFVQANATAVWAPTGIAIAALVLFGYEFWPAILVGAFVTNITTSGTAVTSAGIALGNTLEALLAAYLVNRFANGSRVFERSQDVLKFSLLAGGLAPMVSATIGVTTLSIAGLSAWKSFMPVWATWWLGDVGGALGVAPFLILWFRDHRMKFNLAKTIEVLLLALVFFALGFLAISLKLTVLLIFMSPVYIWVAFRFDRRTMATVLFATTEIFVVSLLVSASPSNTLNASLTLLQAFMATNFAAMMTLAVSVAERKESQARLLAYTEELSRDKSRDEAILSSIGDGLVVTDRAGNVVLINPEGERMFGWSLREIMGKSLEEVIPIEDEKGNKIPMADRPLAAALANGKVVSTVGVTTYYYVRKNGTKFPVALTATPIVIDGVIAGAVDLVKDITAEKEVDREKSEFISIAAHQLRTPLSSIKWLLELILENESKGANRKKLTEAYDANERLINIVRDLLDITRIESGKRKVTIETFDMNALTSGIVSQCKHDAEVKGALLDFHPSAASVLVSADRMLAGEAVKNIVDNAIVYAPAGSPVKIVLAVEDGFCLMTVSNKGPAILEADRPNLFKKFYRGMEAARVKPSGSGLGLYIAKLNVETLGGSISFDSPIEGDQGVAFHIRIPLAPIRR